MLKSEGKIRLGMITLFSYVTETLRTLLQDDEEPVRKDRRGRVIKLKEDSRVSYYLME